MASSFKTTAVTAVVSCILSFFSLAQAQITPSIHKLLTLAAEKEKGKNLDIVAELAIAADPASRKDINQLVAALRKEKTNIKVMPTPHYFSPSGWDAEVELNYLRSSGNTSQESLGLAGKLHRDSGQFHHTIDGFFDLNKNTGVKDKQRWGLGYKLDYDFSESLYVTSFAGYENDQFGAFRERVTTSLGIGFPIINNDRFGWKLEGGPSLLLTKELANEKYKSSFNAFASSLFDWTINDRSKFANVTIFYYGNKNIIESKTDLTVKINGSLSSKFSYDIKYDQEAVLDRKKTDTVARAGLQYDF